MGEAFFARGPPPRQHPLNQLNHTDATPLPLVAALRCHPTDEPSFFSFGPSCWDSGRGGCRRLAPYLLSGLLFDLVFAYDDHLFSVPVSCAEYGRRQRSQLRLVGMRACNDRLGGAEKARAPGSARGWQRRYVVVWQCGRGRQGRGSSECVSGCCAQTGLTATTALASTTSAANRRA